MRINLDSLTVLKERKTVVRLMYTIHICIAIIITLVLLLANLKKEILNDDDRWIYIVPIVALTKMVV